MISRKSITAIAAATLIVSLGSTSASFAATATPAPKKPVVAGGAVGAEGTAKHETGEVTKTHAAKKTAKAAGAALTAWRSGDLAAKKAYRADLAAAVAAFKIEKTAAANSATRAADLVAAKNKYLAARTAAKTKFDAAVAALGAKPVK